MQDFKELKVWQKAHQLTLATYKATTSFPPEETYGITAQMRSAALSVPANIAEGCGRSGKADFARFLHIAFGSVNELEYYILLASDLGFLRSQDYTDLMNGLQETRMMLASLIKKLRRKVDD